MNIAWQWLAAAGVAGLVAGSFLNVVIYRLPPMLERRWRRECRAWCGENGAGEDAPLPSLAHPASHCPLCKRALKWRHNVPLLSYIALRGRCAWCHAKISPRYPAIELLTALAWVSVFIVHGATTAFAAGAILVSFLITLAAIDQRGGILPDEITLPLLWLGLAVNAFGLFTDARAAVLGAIAGYASFFLINQLFILVRKKHGLGGGDMKLLAALGAWFGWQTLPGIVLVASVTGLMAALSMIVFSPRKYTDRISFGPYLSLAGGLAFLFTEVIRNLPALLLYIGE